MTKLLTNKYLGVLLGTKTKGVAEMSENTSQKIRSIIAKECGVKVKSVTNNTQFMSGQGLGYFDCMNALYSLQHKFHVELPESDYEEYKTVGSLIKKILSQQRVK